MYSHDLYVYPYLYHSISNIADGYLHLAETCLIILSIRISTPYRRFRCICTTFAEETYRGNSDRLNSRRPYILLRERCNRRIWNDFMAGPLPKGT